MTWLVSDSVSHVSSCVCLRFLRHVKTLSFYVKEDTMMIQVIILLIVLLTFFIFFNFSIPSLNQTFYG